MGVLTQPKTMEMRGNMLHWTVKGRQLCYRSSRNLHRSNHLFVTSKPAIIVASPHGMRTSRGTTPANAAAG
eukprot:CAMPEP_0119329912 /NCGR_PEP_ID=MMETSP1333-20130426/77009_1 /TAXON_ID=418940 /ORGANISM="Scyphosphaera apsteinii, Strain RCC1455" /LENGTH=70 /DNA_ID=CAMNT_0007339155 /DNA_START=63 /DNA_END=271 /DNA_ORIENTATION=+